MLMPMASLRVSSWLVQSMTFTIGHTLPRARRQRRDLEASVNNTEEGLLYRGKYGVSCATWRPLYI